MTNPNLERTIVHGLLVHLAEHGFDVIAVDDGGDELIALAPGNHTAVLDAVFAVEWSNIIVRKELHLGKPGPQHAIAIVLGNGVDCIADWNYTHNDPDGFNRAMDAFHPETFGDSA